MEQLGDALVRARLITKSQARAAYDEYNTHLRREYYTRLGAKFGLVCEDDEVGDFCRGFLQQLAASQGRGVIENKRSTDVVIQRAESVRLYKHSP